MTITKEAFVDLQEKYTKVMKLLEEDSKLDPETEPFLSKYSARQILIGMKANIENLIRNQSTDGQDNVKITAMLGVIYLYLGMVAIDTEEISTGERHLEKCKETIEKHQEKPEMILLTLNMYNQFGILWSQREPEKSKVYLEKAEQLYLKYKEGCETPVDISDLFQVNIETYDTEIALKNLEKIHTLTLYYLAQIYGAMKEALKSSIYCHITLQRQLQMSDYDPIDWALNAATLSQFFMEKNGFKQARHHLAASSYILGEYEKELNTIMERNEAFDAKMETFKHRSADVARCWAKYGLLLLAKSKERLLNHTEDIDINCSMSSDLSKLEITPDSTISSEDLKHLNFEGIDVAMYESQVTDQFILTLEDARKLFLNAQQWASKAHEYYTLDSLASDFIEIVLDQTQLYLNLLFFEDNPENQAKLHKRRVNLLENILDKVNSQYYLQYCRQVWFELARTYADILDIKADKLRETNSRPTPQALSKMNSLVEKSILQYNNFIDSFKDKVTGKLPDKLPEDVEKPFLQAYFHIAALYGRYVTLDKQVQLRNTEASLEYYKFVSEYCEKHVKAKDLVSMEHGICKEMVTLLPIKIIKLKVS
ncbi:KIF1-binding protein homolog [Anoplophora glabripennis]|nr:KIF1-binding protein homolog [Anoplophora glabripennis]